MEIFTKKFIKGYFKRNKNLFLITLAICIIFFVIGGIIGYVQVNGETGQISQVFKEAASSGAISNTVSGDVSSVYIFTHNIISDFLIILGGFLFSILSVLSLAFNFCSIGSTFGVDLSFALVGIGPHGIFEYTASIFAVVAAFIITKIEIQVIKSFKSKDKTVKEVLKESNVKFRDIILSVIIVIILLAIASIIEGHITWRIITAFYGF